MFAEWLRHELGIIVGAVIGLAVGGTFFYRWNILGQCPHLRLPTLLKLSLLGSVVALLAGGFDLSSRFWLPMLATIPVAMLPALAVGVAPHCFRAQCGLLAYWAVHTEIFLWAYLNAPLPGLHFLLALVFLGWWAALLRWGDSPADQDELHALFPSGPQPVGVAKH